MAIVENWLPPSRENWEWICYVWQFFPVVRCAHARAREMDTGLQADERCVCAGYGGAMGARVLSAGQNVDRVKIQYPRESGLGHWRDHGASYPAVYLLHTAQGAGE
jgi:hypothetical protein